MEELHRSSLVPISIEIISDKMDGVINNGLKEQPEVKAKAPDLTALFEEAKRTVREDATSREDGKKQSVLARLHTPTPPEMIRQRRQKAQKGTCYDEFYQ